MNLEDILKDSNYKLSQFTSKEIEQLEQSITPISHKILTGKRLGITKSYPKSFQDHRHPYYVDYSVHQLLA